MRRKRKKLAEAARLLACGQLRIERPGQGEDAPETARAEALAAIGLVATEPLELDEEFALWPENVPVFNFWQAVQTQWRTGGMGGATGLDYGGVQACMALRGIQKKDQAALFAGLQVMEVATLNAWDKKK